VWLAAGDSSDAVAEDAEVAFAEAAVRAGRTVVVTCPHRDLLPADLPHQVRWYPALPFATLMPRTARNVRTTRAGCARSGWPSGCPPRDGRSTRSRPSSPGVGRAGIPLPAVALAPTMDTATAATRACAHLEDFSRPTAPLAQSRVARMARCGRSDGTPPRLRGRATTCRSQAAIRPHRRDDGRVASGHRCGWRRWLLSLQDADMSVRHYQRQ
jgi:hypothetical protein